MTHSLLRREIRLLVLTKETSLALRGFPKLSFTFPFLWWQSKSIAKLVAGIGNNSPDTYILIG